MSRRVRATIALLACAYGCTSAQPTPPKTAPAAPPPPATPGEPPAPPEADETPDAEFRKRPPPAGPEGGFSVPIPHEERLKNGLRVLVIEQRGVPLATAQLVLDRGAEQGAPAVGAFTGAMLLGGTSTRTAQQLAEQLEGLGAIYGAGIDLDTGGVHVTVLRQHLGAALEIIADVARSSTFADDEIERVRGRRLTALLEEGDSDKKLLARATEELVYPERHPYRGSPLGDEASLKAVKRADLQRFYREHVQPDSATLVVAGDVDHAQVFAEVSRRFGGWRGHATPRRVPRAATAKAPAARVLLVDRASAQTTLAVVAPSTSRTHDDHDTLVVLSTLLSRRVNAVLRERRGLTYGASARATFRHGEGLIEVGGAFAREHAGEALSLMLGEIKALRDEAVSANELLDARALLSATSARFETSSSTATALAELGTYRLPGEDLMTLRVRLQMVTPERVQKAAQKYLAEARLRVAAVGDRETTVAQLEKVARGVAVRAAPSKRPPSTPPVEAGASH